MDILVDENIPSMTVRALTEMGHDVRDLRGSDDEGSPDDVVWQMAQDEKRLLITTDRGFATHRGEDHCGVLAVCLRRPNRRRIHERVLLALESTTEDTWRGLVVVMRDRTRSMWPPPCGTS